MNKLQKTGFYGWTNATLLFFIYLTTTGLIYYGLAAIFPVMITTMDWSRGDASVAQSISTILFGFLVPLTAYMMTRVGVKNTIALGLFFLLLGLILLGTVTTKLWQWTLIWSVIISIGFSFAALMPMQTIIMHWFNVKRITVLGFVASGAPLGGFLAQPFFTRLIIKTNSWESAWLTAAGFAFFALAACFFVKNNPKDLGQYPDGVDPDKRESTGPNHSQSIRTFRTEEEWTLRAAIGTPVLYFSMIVSMVYFMPVIMLTIHGILHFTDVGISRIDAANIVSLILLGSGVSRFPAGWIGDRIEPRWVITGSFVVLLGSFLIFWKSIDVEVLLVFGFLFGCAYGSILVLIPAMLGNYFGPESFPKIMGFMAPFLVVINSTVPVGAGIIADRTGTYDLAFLIVSLFISSGLVCAGLCAPPTKRKTDRNGLSKI